MSQLFMALAAFLALHSIPALPPVRAGAIALLGRRTYLGLYSLVSVVVLAWLFHAALNTDYIELWAPADWQAILTLVLAPLGVLLVTAGLLSTNPFSISFRHGDEPGAIVEITRHPVQWGFTLWSLGHLVVNGDLRSLVLFGGLGLFSVAGLFILDRRARRRIGPGWPALAARYPMTPLAGLFKGKARLRIDAPLALSLAITAAITIWLLMGGHAALFGADPITALSY
ncbi:NnrU family protein [Rhizobium sp. S153]|uniref:NnrU family protein n=1 Tax=Ciceribacter sichuanensis TaxID=2949647 RepID=A0ABT0VDB7_9HYPH|nr:NnrU family protein [Ciceribacter sp. S153]